jgi:F-type H+-transporting ATPase subunit epsilon
MMNCRIWGGGLLIFSGPAQGIQVPGSQGQLGILPGHAPLTTTIHPGLVRVFYEKQAVSVEITSGVCLVEDDQVHMWASHASIIDSLDECMVDWIPVRT